MISRIAILTFAFAAAACAQATRPPVVFVRGYDFGWLLSGSCTPSDPAGTFGTLPAQVQAEGAMVFGFDNCAASGRKNVPVAVLGALLGQFLATIDAPQVDV